MMSRETKKAATKPIAKRAAKRTISIALILLLTADMLMATQGLAVLADTIRTDNAQETLIESTGTPEIIDASNITETPNITEDNLQSAGQAAADSDSESESDIDIDRESGAGDGTEEAILLEPETSAALPANPVHHCMKENEESDGSDDRTDFSYVYFGSYPQSEVTDSVLTNAIDSAIAAGNGTAAIDGAGMDVEIDGTKYRRIAKTDTSYTGYFGSAAYRYFEWQRIRWRVLDNNDNGTMFVMADSALDCKYYHDASADVTWEDSSIRSWLNDSFYQAAFSAEEQEAITKWQVENEAKPDEETRGGNNTTDKVYLLSIGETANEDYGFCSDNSTYSASRKLKASDYARVRGTPGYTSNGYEGTCWWWLRSSSGLSYHASVVLSSGNARGIGSYTSSYRYGIAPALHLDSSSVVWSKEEIHSFSYASGSEKDYKSYFFYNDTYFADSAYVYQSELATTSMCMALSVFGSNMTDDYKNKSRNLKNFLINCGFPEKNFATNEGFTIKPSTDTIGVGASYKKITDKDGQAYTLIAVGVRGGGYESEWASNFTLGAFGPHQGFREARDKVLTFLSKYIVGHNISGKIKIWIAGYSRAAATTNMVAGRLDDGYFLGQGIELKPKDIYAFCFECPQGALKSDDIDKPLYNNIFNIINPVDIVTKVAPFEPSREFGFWRYGVEKWIPTMLTDDAYIDRRTRMLKYYDSMASTDKYIVDDFQMKKISVKNLIWDTYGLPLLPERPKAELIVDDMNSNWDQQAFLDNLVRQLFLQIGTRQKYVDVYQNNIRDICSVIFGLSAGQWSDFKKYLFHNLKQNEADIVAYISAPQKTSLVNRIENILARSLDEAGVMDYSEVKITIAAEKIAALLLEFGALHPNYTVSAISNIEGIGAAHYPELCLAWLMSFDPSYHKANTASFASGAYRVLHINCPLDVKVYDGQGRKAAEIRNDTVGDDNDLVCYINEAGEKLVYLPFTQDYTVEMCATDDGKMDYSISEYSEGFGGTNRVLNYYSLPLSEGKTYQSEIPAVSLDEIEAQSENGTNAAYNIVDWNGREIEADLDIRGLEVADATYRVEAESNDSAYGYVMGNAVVIVGGYARVTAMPNDGYRFSGWYSNDTLVSTESDFRFLVTQNVTLTAQFVPDNTVAPDDEPIHYPGETFQSLVNDDMESNHPAREKTKNYATKINLRNKKTYHESKKVIIYDRDGIKTVRLNNKIIQLRGKKSCSFKLTKYRKHLKKKGKWNRLIVTDMKKKKKTIKFKTK